MCLWVCLLSKAVTPIDVQMSRNQYQQFSETFWSCLHVLDFQPYLVTEPTHKLLFSQKKHDSTWYTTLKVSDYGLMDSLFLRPCQWYSQFSVYSWYCLHKLQPRPHPIKIMKLLSKISVVYRYISTAVVKTSHQCHQANSKAHPSLHVHWEISLMAQVTW